MSDEDAVATLWHSLLTRLANDERVSRQALGFLNLIEPVAILGETLFAEVPNEITKGMIEQRIMSVINEYMATNADFGGPIRMQLAVNADLEGAKVFEQETTAAANVSQAAVGSVPGAGIGNPIVGANGSDVPNYLSGGSLDVRPYDTRLNPKYTFDTFVIGGSNRFAHAAAFAVAEEPAKSYNPLFIYGDSGLGKTHLLHAIGHYTIALHPKRKVRYVSSEEFTNEFINAIQNNKNSEFQSAYRDIDLLLIDDIQFLSGKEQTQEAFFHTFNTLHMNNKQVVITSDKPPKDMDGFEERMLTRFSWGLTTDIQAPELETRIAILRKKADNDRLRVPDDIIEYMAQVVSSNIRELEGTLIRVNAFANLNHQPINMNLVQTVLRDVIQVGDASATTTPSEIMSTVANFYGISQEDLSGSSRIQAIAQARQIAMYLCREQTSLSLPKIGQLFGGRDHTTVMYACRKVREDMNRKREIYSHVTDIITRIKSNQRS
jgi:chromosomal replication initiator protein